MHNICSNSKKILAVGVRISKSYISFLIVGFTISLASILAIIIDQKVAKTWTSFLA